MPDSWPAWVWERDGRWSMKSPLNPFWRPLFTTITWELRCQFHQHFTGTFFVQTSFWQLHVSRKSCQKALSCVKFARLTLMKLTEGFLYNIKKVDHCTCSQTWGSDLRLISLCKVYAKLLHVQNQKAQKDSQVNSVFCTFGICTFKNCSKNVGEINLPLLSSLLWTPYEFQFLEQKAPLNNDHLSTAVTNLGSQGSLLFTGLEGITFDHF